MLQFLEKNKDLLKYSSFHTPATARYFFELGERDNVKNLHDIWKYAQAESLPIVFIGSGTNIIFGFDVFEGIIIRNNLKGKERNGDNIRVYSGELISPLSLQISKEEENSPYSKWIGLPGTIGGAVAGNAGCFGFEIKDSILEVEIFDIEIGEYRTILNGDLDFSYRHSIIKNRKNWFIVSALFQTQLISAEVIDSKTFRSGKQPGGFTCGSFFRNPPNDSAGRLIDKVELKGYRIGGVKISELHGNFFVNDEKGSYENILALRDIAKQRVYGTFGIELHEEARIIENK